MINIPYDKILEKICQETGKSQDEITKLVETKLKQLPGLISREGAAYIVANELGVSISKKTPFKINEIPETGFITTFEAKVIAGGQTPSSNLYPSEISFLKSARAMIDNKVIGKTFEDFSMYAISYEITDEGKINKLWDVFNEA